MKKSLSILFIIVFALVSVTPVMAAGKNPPNGKKNKTPYVVSTTDPQSTPVPPGKGKNLDKSLKGKSNSLNKVRNFLFFGTISDVTALADGTIMVNVVSGNAAMKPFFGQDVPVVVNAGTVIRFQTAEGSTLATPEELTVGMVVRVHGWMAAPPEEPAASETAEATEPTVESTATVTYPYVWTARQIYAHTALDTETETETGDASADR